MVRVLRNEDIASVLDMRLAMVALEEGYRELGQDLAVTSPRIDLLRPRTYADSSGVSYPGAHMLKTMSASTSKYAAIRFLSDLLFWRQAEQGFRRERVPEQKSSYSVTRGLILLFSVATGELVAVLAEGHIRNLRVGAAAGLAARLLSRQGSTRIGLLGAGFMARAHIQAIAVARNIREVRIFSPNSEHASRLACEISSEFGIEATSTEKPADAVCGADIVVTASNALSPILRDEWLRKGMHITCTRHCEIEKTSYLRFDNIFLNSKRNANVWHYEAISEDREVIPESILRDYSIGYPPGGINEIDWEKLPDLPDLLLGRHPGRKDDSEITCFDNSVGFGLQFAAVAGKVYEIAKTRNIGKDVSGEAFPGLVRDA